MLIENLNNATRGQEGSCLAGESVPVLFCFWTWDFGDVGGSVCDGSSRTLKIGAFLCKACRASLTLKLRGRKRILDPDLFLAEVEPLLDGPCHPT